MSGNATPSRRGFVLGSLAGGAAAGLATAVPSGVATAATRAAYDDASVDILLTPGHLRAAGSTLRTGAITGHSFSLLGLTWQGGPPVSAIEVRTRADGVWTPWRALSPLHDRPDAGGEGRPGLRATEPLWTGGADAVDVRGPDGGLPGLTLALVDPGPDPLESGRRKPGRPQKSPRPTIIGRRTWGANERWRNGGPWYNRTIQQVHVHHTVNSNDYDADDVAPLLRSIYRYHTKSLGWSDVGYNFLVDRFGRIWEGRAGGVRKAVRGAHTLGFNETSTGVAAIGNFETARPTGEMLTALVHLAAWKLDKYGRRPGRRAGVWSHGSDKFPAGQKVRLPVIDGHRDTNDTACPGKHLYRKLPEIRRRTARRVDRFDPED